MPFVAFAQAKTETLKVGGYVVEYDKKLDADTNTNGKNDRASYYLKDQLVFAAYDENEDGKSDLWFRYKNGETADVELADANADGKPDTITELDPQEKAEVVFDARAKQRSSSGGLYAVLGIAIIVGAAFFGKKLLKRQP